MGRSSRLIVLPKRPVTNAECRAAPWTLVDGTFSDTLVPDDAPDEELRDYDAGGFEYYGESCASCGRTRRSRDICAPRSSDGRCGSS